MTKPTKTTKATTKPATKPATNPEAKAEAKTETPKPTKTETAEATARPSNQAIKDLSAKELTAIFDQLGLGQTTPIAGLEEYMRSHELEIVRDKDRVYARRK